MASDAPTVMDEANKHLQVYIYIQQSVHIIYYYHFIVMDGMGFQALL